MWFLHKKVLLTKDNLLKRKWTDVRNVFFVALIKLLIIFFLSCQLARQIWRLIHFTFIISPSTSVTNVFGNWLYGVDRATKALIRIGVCAFLWAIWNCQNDVVFNRANSEHFLQVIHRAAHWIHAWSCLLLVHQRGRLVTGCTRLLAVVRSIFNQGGWRYINRLQDV